MSRFKIKDLMIDVLPQIEQVTQPVGWYTCIPFRTCHWYITPPTTCHWFLTPPPTCPWVITRLPTCHPYLSPYVVEQGVPCAAGSDLPIDPGKLPGLDPRVLDMLREQLKVEMEQVEAAAERAATQMAPQTIEEVDMLEAKLHEALGELKSLRGNIEKRQAK